VRQCEDGAETGLEIRPQAEGAGHLHTGRGKEPFSFAVSRGKYLDVWPSDTDLGLLASRTARG